MRAKPKKRGNGKLIARAQVTVPEAEPLLDQIRRVKGALESTLEQAKWRGAQIQLDASFFLGILGFLEELTERVEALEPNIKLATQEKMEAAVEANRTGVIESA